VMKGRNGGGGGGGGRTTLKVLFWTCTFTHRSKPVTMTLLRGDPTFFLILLSWNLAVPGPYLQAPGSWLKLSMVLYTWNLPWPLFLRARLGPWFLPVITSSSFPSSLGPSHPHGNEYEILVRGAYNRLKEIYVKIDYRLNVKVKIMTFAHEACEKNLWSFGVSNMS
jgi:hypothetical protein